MVGDDPKIPGEGTGSASDGLPEKLEAAGWGVFFVWIGIAFLADVGFGAALLGIGVIVLGAQAARKLLNVEVERFWLVVGLVFLLGGLWTVLEIDVPLVPLLFIAGGIAMLASAVTGKRWGGRGS